MKKIFIITLIIIISIAYMGLISYGQPTPQYGGKLRILSSSGVMNVGYAPKQVFPDHTHGTIWSDRILDLMKTGDFQPTLAESYNISSDLKTITIHLKRGIKYQDGTEFNAKALQWSFQTSKETGAIAGSKRIDKIEATGEYTVVVTLNQKNNQVIYDLARIYQYSPTAFNIAGGGDIEKSKDWATNHSVSTAALQVTDFQRDVVIKMKKFSSYWRPGRPYLDEVELRFVKEPATCSAMIQAKQADIWMQSTAQEAADLKLKGFQILQTPTLLNNIYPDSKNADSPFANKKVREAIEYAIDRPAMAKALGFGFEEPINQLATPGTQGYNSNYKTRSYNPAKAKQLLAEAGFPNGFKTKMTLLSTALNRGAVIQNYLKEIGIVVDLDVADVGRYWGAINGGWQGLLLGVSAINPEYCVAWLHHFGPEPIMKFATMAKSPEYLGLCDKLVIAPNVSQMRDLTMQMVTQASEDVMAIPLTVTMGTSVAQTNVHSNYYKDVDWTYWWIHNDWIEKK
jgi:peptide/nickel transport system substrate-binding protein